MSHHGTPPEPQASGPPFVFIDRSLGRMQVPKMLRAGGVQLITLAQHYGIPADEQVDDLTWIAFMKDANIRRRAAEREAIKISGARCFCLGNANLPAVTMAERYLANLRPSSEHVPNQAHFWRSPRQQERATAPSIARRPRITTFCAGSGVGTCDGGRAAINMAV